MTSRVLVTGPGARAEAYRASARVMHLTLVGRVEADTGTIVGCLIKMVALILGVLLRDEAGLPVVGVLVAVSGGWPPRRRDSR